MAEDINIRITPDEMTIDASGFPGTTCLDELAEMTTAMEMAGIKSEIGDQTKKGDYYERDQETVRQ
jgi:hypothetical protein